MRDLGARLSIMADSIAVKLFVRVVFSDLLVTQYTVSAMLAR